MRVLVLVAVTVAAGWAIALCFSSAPVGTTPISGLHAYTGNRWIDIVVLTVAAACAAWSLWRRPSLRTLAALTPLQIVLFLAAASSLEAVLDSAYADGVVRPRAFIFSDQFLTISVIAWYTVAVIDAHRGVRL